MTDIDPGSNIDNIRDLGIYLYNGWEPTYSGDLPFKSAFGVFIVLFWVLTPYQIVINTVTGIVYIRGFVDNTWTEWTHSS